MTYGSRYIPMTYFDSLSDAREKMRESSLTALELQLDLIEFLKSSRSLPAYENFINVYGSNGPTARHAAPEGIYSSDLRSPLTSSAARARALRVVVGNAVSAAPTYYVTGDMSEMVKMAAEEMPAAGLSPSLIPSPSGFIVFARPLPLTGPSLIKEHDGTEFNLRAPQLAKITAIAWRDTNVRSYAKNPDGEMVPGLEYFLFMNAHDMAVASNLATAEILELGKTVEKITVDGGDGGYFCNETQVRQVSGALPIYDFSGWTYGQSWQVVTEEEEGVHGPDGFEVPAQKVHALVDQARRYLLATWLMLGQTVTKLQAETPPRYLRRRASRVMSETGDIVIIRLRKEITDPSAPRDREPTDDDIPWYTHRHLVRGCWRTQHYGPNSSLTKLIWVDPYIRGPKDAPLILKDKVFSLEV